MQRSTTFCEVGWFQSLFRAFLGLQHLRSALYQLSVSCWLFWDSTTGCRVCTCAVRLAWFLRYWVDTMFPDIKTGLGTLHIIVGTVSAGMLRHHSNACSRLVFEGLFYYCSVAAAGCIVSRLCALCGLLCTCLATYKRQPIRS
jgi:hypothetical protein